MVSEVQCPKSVPVRRRSKILNVVQVRCSGCLTWFYKAKKEVDRIEARGGRHFCTIACFGTYRSLYSSIENCSKLIFHGFKPDVAKHFLGMYPRVRRGATTRNIPFEITRPEFVDLAVASGGVCAVTGIPFSTRVLASARVGERRPYMPSVDRKDSGGPYSAPNCRLVLVGVNLAMNSWGEEFFIDLLKHFQTRQMEARQGIEPPSRSHAKRHRKRN